VVLGALLSAGGPQAAAQTTIPVPVGANVQQLVDANPPGTRYLLGAGIHRAQSVVPKDGDVLAGEPGAVLNGCLALENWEREGDWWVHAVPYLGPQLSAGDYDCADPMCAQTQDFYLDGVRLKPESALAQVQDSRRWFLDRAQGRVYMLADPTGLVAELGGPATTAIDCAPPGHPVVNGVMIEDLTIERYPCRPQVGMVRLGGGSTIRRCAVVGSHAYGIQLMWGAGLVQDCYIADNGMCGIGGTGIGVVVEGCEIAHNVWPLYASLAWDNGGVKMAVARDMVFRRNYIHHNHGPGLWVDIQTTLLTVEDNIVELNDWEGILVEISDQAVVRRNICRWNGVRHRLALWGAQICVQNSARIQITSNYLETGPDFNSPWGSRQGVMAINQNERRFEEQILNDSFGVRDLDVKNNLLVMPNGGHNGVDYGTLGWDSYEDFLAAGLVWADNRYLIGQPLRNQWSWRRPPDWDATVGKWLFWEDWHTVQDENSSLETFGPFDYPPSGVRQLPLIQETTGHDYAALKTQLTRRPPLPTADRDADGLSDEWERRFFGTVTADTGAGDPDADGLDNAREEELGTHPLKADTDDDRLNDLWESTHGSNPLVFDSDADADADGRTTLEEWQDGTDLAVGEPVDLPADETGLSLWLTPASRLQTASDGTLSRWSESGPLGLAVEWFGPARVGAASPTGVSLVEPGDMLLLPGRAKTWGTPQSGFTLSLIFQPTAISQSRNAASILTNELYLSQGFRLMTNGGYVVASSTLSGGSLSLSGHTRLVAGRPHLITFAVNPGGAGGALYLDGRLEAVSALGGVVPSGQSLMLGNTGGVTPQPGRFGDVVVFNRLLNNQERRSIEGFLQQKFLTGIPVGPDGDRDALPDAWEISNSLDPLTPGALADQDRDGVTNLEEYRLGLNPAAADTDGDRLPDGWEVAWGTNPLVDDAEADPDQDGLNNLEEFENGTDPNETNLDPPFLAFNEARLWWRANHGLESTEAGFSQWLDSTPARNRGLAGAPGPVLIAAEPWADRPVLTLSETPVVSSDPVDTGTLLHTPGATLTLAVRPPATPAPAGFRRLASLGPVLIGVDSGRAVLRNESGSISVTAATALPSTPFVLSCVITAATGECFVQIDGVVVAASVELGLDSSANPLTLGGPGAWPADVAEVLIHAGSLAPLKRRFAERVLRGKWLGTGPLAGDSDGDGLPDWWEHEACTDPAVPDAGQDADWDGITNLAAHQSGSPGFVWLDLDADSMHDGWERLHGLDAGRDDGAEDPDSDGVTNALEHTLLSPPFGFDAADSWLRLDMPSGETPGFRVFSKASQRSWAKRARLETTSSLQPESWRWLPPGVVSGRAPGALALEQTSLEPDLPGTTRRFLYLRLFVE